MSYTSPVPGGTVGRTDQGVDISAPPGTPIRAIAAERVIGILPNWYKGQPFIWFQQLGTNTYNYVAEQIIPRVRPGQVVQAGQEVGTVAPSGTGLELGWATRSGQTLARATTGYTEGQATPAGQSYRRTVLGGGAGGGQSSGIAQVWIDAGGKPALANIMAAIAMAESGGDPKAVQQGQPYQTTGWGLWQITPGNSVPSVGVDQQLLDPLTNAHAAVAKEKSQGLSAWTTYTSGAYKQFMGKPDLVKGGYGGTRPGGGSATTPPGPNAAIPQMLDNYVRLRDMPRTAPPAPGAFQWWLQSFTGSWADLNQFSGARAKAQQ